METQTGGQEMESLQLTLQTMADKRLAETEVILNTERDLRISKILYQTSLNQRYYYLIFTAILIFLALKSGRGSVIGCSLLGSYFYSFLFAYQIKKSRIKETLTLQNLATSKKTFDTLFLLSILYMVFAIGFTITAKVHNL